MLKKRFGIKDIFVEWNGLFSVKYRVFVDYIFLVVWECNNFFFVLKGDK